MGDGMHARRLIGRSAKGLVRLLDRPSGRPLLSWTMECAIRRLHGERATVRRLADGYWVIDWPAASVPMERPWPSPSPTQYEELARDIFLQEYTPSAADVVVDVGAGVGWELNLFSRLVGGSGRVLAVEADPATFRWLERRRDLNGLSNVTAIQAAVADAPGEALISSEGYHETHRLVAAGPGHRVPALTLADLVAEHGLSRIDFLKMNIEGAERLALAGMEGIAGSVRNLAVSCHDYMADRGGDDSMRTRAFVHEFLLRHGFEVRERRADDERDWARSYLYARRADIGPGCEAPPILPRRRLETLPPADFVQQPPCD
jgi:FkbM family methyltransferase